MTAVRTRACALAALALAATLGGCGTVGRAIDRVTPFDRDETPATRAAAGQRISVIAFDQRVAVSEALQGDHVHPAGTATVDRMAAAWRQS